MADMKIRQACGSGFSDTPFISRSPTNSTKTYLLEYSDRLTMFSEITWFKAIQETQISANSALKFEAVCMLVPTLMVTIELY